MNRHRGLIGCKHPILSAAMNQVSDARLAIAVHEVGGFPTYFRGGGLVLAAYRRDLRAYKHATGNSNLLLSVGSTLLVHDVVVRRLFGYGIQAR